LAATTVYLADAQHLLSLFTQGLAGRYLHLKSTEALTGQFRPAGATTDGLAIYLAESVKNFDDWRHNLGVYRVAILHQLGYYEFGTFAFALDEALARFPQLPVQSVSATDPRVDLERFFEGFGQPALARRLFMLLEDLRIDSQLPTRFPGIATDLARVMAHALAQRASLSLATSPTTAMLEGLLQYTLGAKRETLMATDVTGRLSALLTAAVPLCQTTSDVYVTANAALVCYRALTQGTPVGSARGTAGDPRADALVDAVATDPELVAAEDFASLGPVPIADADLEITGADFRGELQPELVQRQLRLAELRAQTEAIEVMAKELPPELLAQRLQDLHTGAEPPPLETPPDAEPGQSVTGRAAQVASPRPANAQALTRLIRDELGTLKRSALRDEVVLRQAFGNLSGIARSFLYDEWDYLQQSYRKGWCRLFERRLSGEGIDRFREVRKRHRVLAAHIEKQLRRIRAESLARVKRVTEGDEVDLDQLLAAVVDRRAGLIPDDRVYSRRDRARREVAAAFLLDMSASTDDMLPDSAPPPPAKYDPNDDMDPYELLANPDDSAPQRDVRRVIDVEKDALVLMSEALTVLGDAFAIYGFSGYGRDEVEFYVVKEFGEGLTPKTKGALAAMKPRRSTRMGPAIRHTIKRLQRQDVPLKVMIILSDGFPQDCDYGPNRNDHEYGIQDTARALREAQDRGVVTFCITVDQSGHDYLRRMCPENSYLVIDEIESLPDELSKIYRLLTV